MSDEVGQVRLGSWLVLVALVIVYLVLTIAVIGWNIEGFSNTDDDRWVLIVLSLTPILSWALAFRLARAEWPHQPGRSIAATVTGVGAAAAALMVRGLMAGVCDRHDLPVRAPAANSSVDSSRRSGHASPETPLQMRRSRGASLRTRPKLCALDLCGSAIDHASGEPDIGVPTFRARARGTVVRPPSLPARRRSALAEALPRLSHGARPLAVRSLEIRRHSFTKKGQTRGRGSDLSRDGVRAARAVGERLAAFDHVVASSIPRTWETAVAMGYAVDDLIDMPSPVESGQVEFHAWRDWDNPFRVFNEMADAPSFRSYSARQVSQVLEVVEGLPGTGRALIVGHGGWIENVVAQLLEPVALDGLGGSFWHLDGIQLSFSGAGTASLERTDRYRRR